MMLERVCSIVLKICAVQAHSLDQGVATREDIDKTLKLGMNHPMGPLQLGECCNISPSITFADTLDMMLSHSRFVSLPSQRLP